MNNKLTQETTSTYFNSIIKKNIIPLSVESFPQEVVDNFNCQLRIAFPDESDKAIERVRYLIPYILQSIDWAEYATPLEAWQLRYYYQRDRFIEKTRLNYEEFLSHVPLQKSIEELGLSPEPTFEFILFLKYYYDMRSELRFSPVEQISMAKETLALLAEGEDASIDINAGGKHFKISNTNFVKRILAAIPLEQLKTGTFVNDFDQGSTRNKPRAIDYFIVKTLLDFLPKRMIKEKRGRFSQAERNFGLSVLNYIGRLPSIDQEGICSRGNNVTFDKLMRDFKNEEIPFAMELFL